MIKKLFCSLSILLCFAFIPILGVAAFTASDWAQPEIAMADGFALITAPMAQSDMRQSITRGEFADLAVRVYEVLTGTFVPAASENPFVDTADPTILRAYHLGIVNGISATEYAPDAYLTREQAATILTRVIEKTLHLSEVGYTEGNTLIAANPALFADDAVISDWAKNSVYFLCQYGIITGVGGSVFSPDTHTTREQALLIAARMVQSARSFSPEYKIILDDYHAFIIRMQDFLARFAASADPSAMVGEYQALLGEMETRSTGIQTIASTPKYLGDTMYLYQVLILTVKVLEGI